MKQNLSHSSKTTTKCFRSVLFLSIPPPGQNTSTTADPQQPALGYLTRPADVTALVGHPAVFRCGVPDASPNVTFTFYGSRRNYSLFCPSGSVEDIPQVRQFPAGFHLRNRNVVELLGSGKRWDLRSFYLLTTAF